MKQYIPYIVILILIFALFKECNQKKDNSKQLQINDLQEQNKAIEAHAYFLANELQKQKNATKIKIVEVIKYKKAQRDAYFVQNYGTEKITDSIPATKIIIDLEKGKGCEIENGILTNIVKSKDSTIINVKQQFELSEQNFKTQKNKTLFWKVTAVAGVIGTYFIVK